LRHISWVLGTALVVSACGRQGVSPASPDTRVEDYRAAPPAAAQPSPPPAENQQAARLLAARTVEAFEALESMRATVHTTDLDPADGDLYKGILDVHYQAPAKFMFTVKPGSRHNVGTKMAFEDGDTHISVRPGGMLGFAKVKLPVDDKRVQTSRGFPIMAITQKSMVGRLKHPKAIVGLLGEASLEGKPVQVLSVTGPVLPKGATEEWVYADKTTALPLRGELRIGKQVVFSTTLKDFQPNAQLPKGVFDL